MTAHADVAVHGEARFDHDFTGGSDQVTYAVDITPSTGPLTVTARLLYQTVSSRFVQDLRTDATPAVEQFGRSYDRANKAPSVLATARVTAIQP